ncbi:MAG: hypothetical protein JSV32_06435, partial [Dehalococcoidia bacterium]
RRGSFTYDELANRIYSKYGIIQPLIPELQPRNELDDLKFYKLNDQKEVQEFLDSVKDLMKPEEKETDKSYPKWQYIKDKIILILSRFGVNI